MPEVVPEIETFAQIKVLGIGGGGSAALNRMVNTGVEGVEFIAVNTDAQALHNSKAGTKLHIGEETTRGLGAGADPAVGRQAAEESTDAIREELKGADMVFITSCMGGGTGSGASSIIADIAQDLDILTIGFATRPFTFEGQKRKRNAENAIAELGKHVDTLITIPNDRLLQTIDRSTPLLDAFSVADDVLRQGVQGISDLITVHGLINLDFADVKAIMSSAGSALMGIGRASGDSRAQEAAKAAIDSPLLEVSIDGARGVLFNVIGNSSLGMHEVNEAAETITSAVDPEANIIFGATIDEDMGDELKITVIATGFDEAYHVEAQRKADTSLSYFDKPDSGEDQDQAQTDIDDEVEDVAVDDLELEETESETDKSFVDSQKDPESLWSFDDDDDDFDVPTFVRQKGGDDDSDEDGNQDSN